MLSCFAIPATAQPPVEVPRDPSPVTQRKIDTLIEDVLEAELVLELDPRRSKLFRVKRPVARFSVTNPSIVELVQYGPTEFELVGGERGETTLTIWYADDAGDTQILRYLVRVGRTVAATEYGDLQKRINELFPNSMVQLIPIADKIVIRGQARDAEEANQILAIVGGQTINQVGSLLGPGSYINLGSVARPYPDANDVPAGNLINLLEVPGEQQVMLKVRIAELTRSALREMGADFGITRGDFTLNSLFGGTAGPFTAILDTTDVTLAFSALSSNGYSKILAEPNLVTLNGRPASFVAGGEFAVPTVVGVDGVGAATTDFRSFGTQVFFLPTIRDKDLIRLEVTPSFSTVNNDNAVNGIPGLDVRTATTTVDLREGQWLAIAGLIQDQQSGSKGRVPFLGDIPLLDVFFSRRSIKRDETELVILVSPELIHPFEAEEVPLILPGMEVTEPTDADFYFWGRYEGRMNFHHRSTVWPIQRDRHLQAHVNAIHQTKGVGNYRKCEAFYVSGDHGLSR